MIAVGISAYGRSFGMVNPRCVDATCKFKGPESAAIPGECTGTAGYISNAEINDIISVGSNETSAVTSYYDYDSNSDILLYGGNQWVAFMSNVTRASRTSYYKGWNFAGTVDWAVDLLDFLDDDGDPDGDDDEYLPDALPQPSCRDDITSLDQLDADSDVIPDNCRALYTVQALSGLLSETLQNYSNML